MVKNLPTNAGDMSLIPGQEDHPFLYSCLENPTDRGAWQATVHGVIKKSDMT